MIIPARAVSKVEILAADWTQALAIRTADDLLRLRKQQIVMQRLSDIYHMSLVPIPFLIEAGIGGKKAWPVILADIGSQIAGYRDEAAGTGFCQGGVKLAIQAITALAGVFDPPGE